MIAAKTIAEIHRLLDLKTYSQRQIARLLGVSRGTVGSVALGRRRGDSPRDTGKEDLAESSGPPARCPGCGGLVYMPCLLCKLRKERPRARVQNRPTNFAAIPDLDLRPEHQQRYQEVRARRREAASLAPTTGS
jgi:transcriptional regulator with XRE-family HTH domain